MENKHLSIYIYHGNQNVDVYPPRKSSCAATPVIQFQPPDLIASGKDNCILYSTISAQFRYLFGCVTFLPQGKYVQANKGLNCLYEMCSHISVTGYFKKMLIDTF